MYYFMYFCKKTLIICYIMKTRLIIAAIMLIGFSACAPKYTCPVYAIEKGKEIKTEQAVQKPM